MQPDAAVFLERLQAESEHFSWVDLHRLCDAVLHITMPAVLGIRQNILLLVPCIISQMIILLPHAIYSFMITGGLKAPAPTFRTSCASRVWRIVVTPPYVGKLENKMIFELMQLYERIELIDRFPLSSLVGRDIERHSR